MNFLKNWLDLVGEDQSSLRVVALFLSHTFLGREFSLKLLFNGLGIGHLV